MTAKISTLSTEYVLVPVYATLNGVLKDISGDVVQLAIKPRNTKPVTGDWKTGSWESDGEGGYAARLLIGPSATPTPINLAAGEYDVWVRVVDNPETVVRNAGRLVVE